jgi:hypothetical protein
MAKREKVQDFVIDRATSGDGTAVIAAPGVGNCVRVLGYTLVGGGAVNATWKSGATAKSGAIPLAANTGASPAVGSPDQGARQFQGGDNEAIFLNLSAAVQVSGHGTFQILKTAQADFT